MPSFLSSVAAQRPKYAASSSKPSPWLVSIPLFAASSANLTAIGAFEAIFLQNGLGARDQIGGRNDLVDQPDAIGFLRADHLSGQNELQGATLADQPRQSLRATAARDKSERDLGLAEFRGLDRDPDGAGHRRLAAAAEREAIDRRDHRLAEILDQIEDFLAEAARLLCLERRDMRELADVGSCDESLVAGACQDDAAYCSVVSRIFERGPQILPGRRIQRVEHLGPIDGHIGDGAFFLVQDIRERQ